jgi:hypothetical protein
MKRLLILSFFLAAMPLLSGEKSFNESVLNECDIIFQETSSLQSKAIKIVTKSHNTHIGVIFRNNNQWVVLEAFDQVKFTPLKEFIARSVNKHFTIKRLSASDKLINSETLKKVKETIALMMGKKYDYSFQWSDSKIYCSELVWKVFKNSLNIEIGKLAKVKDLDLSDKRIKILIKKRYKGKIPYEETVITPEQIFCAENLSTVIAQN